MTDTRAWSIIGTVGGIYAALAGAAIWIIGVSTAGTITGIYELIVVVPYLFPTNATLVQQIISYLLSVISQISPTLSAFTLGPLAPLLGLSASSALFMAGIAVAVLGILLLIGGIVSFARPRGGAAMMILFGILLMIIFNLGGVAGFIAGVACWHEK
jgi:hypothetical protein